MTGFARIAAQLLVLTIQIVTTVINPLFRKMKSCFAQIALPLKKKTKRINWKQSDKDELKIASSNAGASKYLYIDQYLTFSTRSVFTYTPSLRTLGDILDILLFYLVPRWALGVINISFKYFPNCFAFSTSNFALHRLNLQIGFLLKILLCQALKYKIIVF